MVGVTGIEPVTLRLSSACSNQLSYTPISVLGTGYGVRENPDTTPYRVRRTPYCRKGVQLKAAVLKIGLCDTGQSELCSTVVRSLRRVI